MLFRKDINGLRAIAVIAVVLFHFNENWIQGGFAGVDVFFVISGFLMTGIIFRGFEQANFSLLRFYVARANRIIPALAVLCLFLVIFGWFYLTPIDYKSLGMHIGSSIGFFSNIVYWRESGYFDASSHEKWLLHTWSLSVEWQFYIFYPIFLVIMHRVMSIKMMKIALLVLTCLGFILGVIFTFKWPNPSYYLLSSRAWEMMLGGIAYVYPFALKKQQSKQLEWLGLTLILASYFLISKSNHWPGYLAIIPVLGAFFVIQSNQDNSLLTRSKAFQNLGRWSYSIYLWHWPIVVAINYFSFNRLYIYLGILCSIFLGYLSHKYIERISFKSHFNSLMNYFTCKPLYIALVILLLGFGVYFTNGVENHYSQDILIANNEALNANPHRCMIDNQSPCFIGNKNNIHAIVVGDSHADALSTAVAEAINLKLSGIVTLTMTACPFIMNIRSTKQGDRCYNENIRRMDYLNKHFYSVPVIWISRTAVYLYGQSNPLRINKDNDRQPSIYFTAPQVDADDLYAELASNLKKTLVQIAENHPVYIVQPIPEMRKNIPKVLAKNLLLKNDDYDLSITLDQYDRRNKKIRSLLGDVASKTESIVLDPIPYLCPNSRCLAQIKGRPLYFDGDHMSEYGNKLLTPLFKQVVEQ